jgi:hypothetical protein
MGSVKVTGPNMSDADAEAAAVIVRRFDRQPRERRIIQVDRATTAWL